MYTPTTNSLPPFVLRSQHILNPRGKITKSISIYMSPKKIGLTRTNIFKQHFDERYHSWTSHRPRTLIVCLLIGTTIGQKK